MLFSYANMPMLSKIDFSISLYPNTEPFPFVSMVNDTHFSLNFNCSQSYEPSSKNYYNEITVTILTQFRYSFLLDCDPENRHKQFEVGYIILSVINALIIIGVAMYSHIWSIRINLRPLRFDLKRIPFLIFNIVGSGLILLLYLLAFKDYNKAMYTLRYAGVIISIPFVFLCWNELFFLIKKLRIRIFKFIRWCDIVSAILTASMIATAFFVENWIFYNLVAGCICVGSIKMFHFNSLK
jgi:hypothetical protein